MQVPKIPVGRNHTSESVVIARRLGLLYATTYSSSHMVFYFAGIEFDVIISKAATKGAKVTTAIFGFEVQNSTMSLLVQMYPNARIEWILGYPEGYTLDTGP